MEEFPLPLAEQSGRERGGNGLPKKPSRAGIGELGRLSSSMKKLEKELKNTDKYKVGTFKHFGLMTRENFVS
ncbi:hypothetical protein RND71_035086 [Anisodus tanguticus]|uniref:Uncharacterized protein n=1 Tax=Anisodus tanguticus TaxID=243964 RepID=A0AAE1R464_9SOLA|nr:hypothetical protein RND71_035086 [Anisodus tanguticus]